MALVCKYAQHRKEKIMNNEQPIEYRNEMNASTCNEVESEILEVIDVKSEIVEDESLLHDVSSYNSKLDISMYLRKKEKRRKSARRSTRRSIRRSPKTIMVLIHSL